MGLLDSLGSTVKSLGGAAVAPLGAAWDLASAPFDGKDDDFGTIVNKMSGRAADAFDPLLNQNTITGAIASPVMKKLEWGYREGIAEPLSTGVTMFGHVAHDPGANFEDLFSGKSWGDAYNIAQHRSLGQAALLSQTETTVGMFPGADTLDPMDKRAYNQIHKNAPFLTSLGSGTVDFVARWYLDPGNVLGKGAKAFRAAKVTREIKAADFAGEGGILPKTFEETNGVKPFDKFKPFKPSNLGSRTEDYLSYINEGARGKPLNGAQIYAATPELQRSAAGRQIAGLLADAGKLKDPAVRGMAQRNVLAVAWGDVGQVNKAKAELAQMGAVGDALKNVTKGNVLDLKTHALGEQIAANPELMASMQNQIDNMDDVAKFVDNHVTKLENLLDTADTLRHAPGVHATGARALAREEGRGILRNGEMVAGPNAVKAPVNWTLERAARLADHPAISSVYQRSQSHMPLKVITHTAQAVAKYGTFDYGRVPMKFTDALRTSHLQGFVSTHDWNGATNQLDSMMKLGAVEPGKRLELLSKVQMARTETEKVALIHAVEKETARGLVAKHGIQKEFGSHKGLQDFIEQVMDKGQAKRTAHLTTLNGRAYAATADGRQLVEGNRVDQITPRANLIDDVDGAPVALPLLETQGRNYVPLFDAALADKMIGRQYGRLATHAQMWKKAGYEIGRLKGIQAATGKSMEKALDGWYAAQDHAVDAASWMMRTWKFGVLFRLGYPLRVIADDHMRIWSQMGAMAILAPLAKETLGNIHYNQFGRYKLITQDVNKAKTRLAEINGLLSDEHVAAYNDRASQVKSLNRKIAKSESAGNDTRTQTLTAERDVLQQAMGDDPNALAAEKQQLEEFLDLGRREQVKSLRKTRRGESPITHDGVQYEGAFGGDMGDAYRVAASSDATFDNLAKVGEERMFKDTSGEGSWQVIHNDNPAHHVAWADALNNQFRQSKVAMFFVKNKDATVDDFVKWIKQPEQRGLRERLPHFAHDPEDWGWRVKQLVDDYLPTQELRDHISKERITPRRLDRMFPDKSALPAVHGATVAHNLGTSRFATNVGKTMNRMYRYLGELPTDRLSRHPYFAALYDSEVARLHAKRLAFAKQHGMEFTQEDVDDITRVARKNALNEVRRTLFDISAHTNAAHMLRFVSPFFAAHQESLQRWWRIVADDPSIIRRLQQGFDMPRKLGLVVDSQTGEPIKDGEMPGPGHSILFQVPKAWGGSNTKLGKMLNDKMAGWRVNENAFNLILQNGIMNPGIGPIVQVPVEAMVDKYAQYKDLERMARLLNPYPPQSLGDMLLPATVRRVDTIIKQDKSAEFARMMSVNLQDKIVDFKLAHGDREPNQAEMAKIEQDAHHETVLESWLRLGQNLISPAPASPRSKYEVFRQGWQKINDQAEAEGKDYDWRIEKFKQKYGEAYLPMIASTATNPGNLDATNETIGALKQHKKLINSVDIKFAGAIVGPAGAYQGADDYSNTAAKWLRDNIQTDSEKPYYSYDNPLQAAREAAIKRGWTKYSQAMDALNVMAQENGLQSYMQSDKLMELKKIIVGNLGKQNIYWGQDYTDFNPGEFDSYLDDLHMIATDKGMRTRGDVKVLGKYLQVRDIFTAELQRRDAAGGSADPSAKSNQTLMSKYRDLVSALCESNLDFETYWFNGAIERDPYLRQTYFKGASN